MRHRLFIIFILCGLALFPLSVHAQRYEKEVKNPRIMWTKQPNSGSGLYTTRNYFVAPGVSIHGGAFYYFGDVDNVGVAFNGGFNRHNLGGGLSIAYQHPISRHCNLRTSILGGTLQGNNAEFMAKKGLNEKRRFQSVVVMPSVGVQYYPFSQVGFYLYGGLGVAVSDIIKFSFTSSNNVTLDGGGAICILPMVQLGLGYTWMLSTSWSLGVELLLNEGLCDTYYANLDAWPLAASQSPTGQATGLGKRNFWSDGWFQVGITVTYQWRNCETCRTINNYAGIKPRKR